MKILLDYAFPITAITPIPEASTSFLKRVCLIVKPKGGVDPGFYTCTSMSQVAAKTDNTNAQQFFNAGMSKVILLCSSDLDVATEMATGTASSFFTLIVSDDFREKYASLTLQDMVFEAKASGTGGNAITVALADTQTGDVAVVTVTGNAISVAVDASTTKKSTVIAAVLAKVEAMALLGSASVPEADEDEAVTAAGATNLTGGAAAVTSIDVGTFKGVVGVSSIDDTFLTAQAIIENRCAFYGDPRNMCYAFGKLLSTPSWKNQQYIEMPYADDIDELGEAIDLFDKKISFVLVDDEFGNALALFAAGGKAITSAYILKNLMIDLQSRALTWLNLNQPDYTLTEATLLENDLTQKVLVEQYIDTRLIPAGKIAITLGNDNFVATGNITVTEPRALWRIEGEMIAQ